MSQKSDEPSLPDRIKGTRRKFLAGLGGLAAAGAASANLGDDDDSGLQAGGLNAPLGSQYYRDQYISSDPSTFDPGVMQAGEQYWLSDGEMGVYDGDQTQQYPVGSTDNPVPEVNAINAGVGSLNADEALNDYQPNSGVSPWANSKLQGQKRVPLPDFERDSNNPKVSPSDIDWSTATVSDPSEIHWPSVITTSQISDPQAPYYCYFAPHNTDGIGLASFDDPFGSWSPNGSPVLDGQYGEPGALVKWDTDEVWIYHNRPNDDTKLVRSADGRTNWTDEGSVYEGSDVANGGHSGYPHPIQANGGVYTYSFWKPREDHARPVVHYSADGKTNFHHTGVYWHNGQEPTGTSSITWNHISVVPYFGGYLAVYAASDSTGTDPTGKIRFGYTENGIHFRDLGVALGSDGSQAWEESSSGVRLSDPSLFWGDDGNLYLVYAGGGGTHVDSIGIAKANFSEVRQ